MTRGLGGSSLDGVTASISRLTISVAELDRSLPLYENVLGLTRRYALPGLVMLADGAGVEVLPADEQRKTLTMAKNHCPLICWRICRAI